MVRSGSGIFAGGSVLGDTQLVFPHITGVAQYLGGNGRGDAQVPFNNATGWAVTAAEMYNWPSVTPMVLSNSWVVMVGTCGPQLRDDFVRGGPGFLACCA